MGDMGSFSRQATEPIVTALQPTLVHPNCDGPKMTVHEAVRKMSFLYERIRNVVDYKDEHLIRKAAIVRILKRQLLLEFDPGVIAEHVLRELIAARYLPNGVLPESVIGEVELRIKKYKAIAKIKAGTDRHLEWLMGMVAVEIEELLVEDREAKAFVTFLYERLADRIRLRQQVFDETERRMQVYVACYRSFIKADDDMLGYKLLRAYLPEWLRPQEWLDDPRPIAERLVAIEQRTRARLHHRLAARFLRAVKPWSASLRLVRDTAKEQKDPAGFLSGPSDIVLKGIAHTAEERYADARMRLRRGTFRATVYLFFTKMLVALLLEVPVELVWYAEVHRWPLVINILFPPALMVLVGLLISVPGQENTERLKKGVQELLDEGVVPVVELNAVQEKRGLRSVLFPVVYAATFMLSFGSVLAILHRLQFTPISSLIFIFFLCVVSFFAFRLRISAREMVVIDAKQGLISSLADFLSLPILRAGQWLSVTISRMNIFLFIFDFIIEAPFKVFLSVLEDWLAFMKEKKEELQ